MLSLDRCPYLQAPEMVEGHDRVDRMCGPTLHFSLVFLQEILILWGLSFLAVTVHQLEIVVSASCLSHKCCGRVPVPCIAWGAYVGLCEPSRSMEGYCRRDPLALRSLAAAP